jgi:glutathione synthase/RimK-type ligase-like ATP-grasp enzyme
LFSNSRLANNKHKTKKFLEERDVPVPVTYDMIDNRQKLFNYDFRQLPESFVIKPNH